MEDVGEILAIDAKAVRGLFNGQPLANDEADRCPVQGGFGPRVVLALHVARCVRPAKPWGHASRHVASGGSLGKPAHVLKPAREGER